MDAREDTAPDAAPAHEAAIDVELRSDSSSSYAAVVSLRGEHDLASQDAIAGALDPIYGNVLVDLSECAFIDSTVIGVLLSRADHLRREGHRLELVAPPENATVFRVLEIVGVGGLLTIHDRRPTVQNGPSSSP
jgi:anti-anti-sigma factor